MHTIVVDSQGTELGYLDSGAPPTSSYTTLFALHGMVFASGIWEKVMALAPKQGLRIVAINRRDYPSSTPLSPAELATIASGTDEDRATLLRSISSQISTFITTFAERNQLPSVSSDGKTGGFGIVGWSMGSCATIGVPAYIDAQAPKVKQYLGENLRAVILLEGFDTAMGMDMSPKNYSPPIDEAIPFDLRIPFWMTWQCAYFKHGDLSKRDVNEISYVVPWTGRAPSIYNMTEKQVEDIAYLAPAWGSDLPTLIHLKTQLSDAYKKATFDKGTRALLPRMKIWNICGDKGASVAVNAFFIMQNDNDAAGGGHINFKLVPGSNHFMQWDDPDVVVDIFRSILSEA